MMKKNLFWLIVIMLTGSLLTMTSCSDDDITPNTENPGNNSGNQENQAKLKNCEKKVYFDDISTEDPFLQTALKQRFPNNVSIDEAEIIFVSKQRSAEIDEEIEDCLLRGGLVVFFDPGLDNGWDIPDYTPVEGVTDIFFAANNYEQYYTMVGEPEDDIFTTEAREITSHEQEQINASVAYGLAHPNEDPVVANMEKEEYGYPSVEYFNNRLTPFIDWIEEMDAINAEDDEFVTKASLPQVPSYEEIKINVRNDGVVFERDFPISYNVFVASGAANVTEWYLTGNSSVSVRFNIYPLFMQSSNGETKAGDYYIVIGRVTPHNAQLWHPRQESGGLFNMGRCRLFGLWFKEMNAAFTICSNKEGTPLEGVRFEMDPLPENEIESKNYSSGSTGHIEGSISGGKSQLKGKEFEGKVSGGGSWSSTENFTLNSLNFNTNSFNGEVRAYYHTTKVVEMNYNSITDYDEYFRPACHNDFNGRLAWVWHVPSGTGGVGDNKDVNLYVKAKLDITYSTWYHWRGAVRYDSNREDYKKDFDPYIAVLPAPSRQTWGLIALKNAFPASTVITNIRYWKDGKEVKSNVSSYTNNETAKMALPEGTYDVTFEQYNPGQGNKFLGKYRLKNVQVHQGGSLETATTEVSTVNAIKEQ